MCTTRHQKASKNRNQGSLGGEELEDDPSRSHFQLFRDKGDLPKQGSIAKIIESISNIKYNCIFVIVDSTTGHKIESKTCLEF